MSHNQKTAILIFANSSSKEACLKPFFKAEALFSTLNSEIINKVKNTNLPYFIIDENEQIGHTFGERFANAIKSIYKKGYDTVISVGNDTPQLKTSQILKAHASVTESNYVLGPSQNGGFYLLALHKSNFNYNTFIKLPWQTSAIRKSLQKHFLYNNTYTLLKYLKDLNTTLDLSYFTTLFSSISKQILLVALQSLGFNRVYNTLAKFSINPFILEFSFNKGSPTLA
jgi:glycosyltransferase A (GT-A) superfamily protein (DUF2064 family)